MEIPLLEAEEKEQEKIAVVGDKIMVKTAEFYRTS